MFLSDCARRQWMFWVLFCLRLIVFLLAVYIVHTFTINTHISSGLWERERERCKVKVSLSLSPAAGCHRLIPWTTASHTNIHRNTYTLTQPRGSFSVLSACVFFILFIFFSLRGYWKFCKIQQTSLFSTFLVLLTQILSEVPHLVFFLQGEPWPFVCIKPKRDLNNWG